MSEDADVIARRAAEKLAAGLNQPSLVPEVEHSLQKAPESETYEPVSLSVAALVVSVASLAWTIYNDIKNANRQVDKDALTRRIRVRIAGNTNLVESQQHAVIEVVVDETLKYQQ